jgi:hypothetical protein
MTSLLAKQLIPGTLLALLLAARTTAAPTQSLVDYETGSLRNTDVRVYNQRSDTATNILVPTAVGVSAPHRTSWKRPLPMILPPGISPAEPSEAWTWGWPLATSLPAPLWDPVVVCCITLCDKAAGLAASAATIFTATASIIRSSGKGFSGNKKPFS